MILPADRERPLAAHRGSARRGPGDVHREIPGAFYEAINACLDKRDFVIVETPWNFADFGTQQGPMRAGGNRKGLLTRNRQPKMAAHYFRKRWDGFKK